MQNYKKRLNVLEWVEVAERNKDGPFLLLFFRESSVPAKENQIEKNPFKKPELSQFPTTTANDVICPKNINLFMKKEVKEHNIGNWRMITVAAWKNNNDGSIGGVGMLVSTRTFKALLTVGKVNVNLKGNPPTRLISC